MDNKASAVAPAVVRLVVNAVAAEPGVEEVAEVIAGKAVTTSSILEAVAVPHLLLVRSQQPRLPQITTVEGEPRPARVTSAATVDTRVMDGTSRTTTIMATID